MAPIFSEITLPKESIKKNVNQWTKLDYSIRSTRTRSNIDGHTSTDISVNYGLTGETREIVTPGKRIPRKKINIKSLATSPPRKDPIPNKG